MTRYALTFHAETRDPGHTVWSCHDGRLEGTLEDLRGLAAALRLPDLREDITDAAAVIDDGQTAFTVAHADEEDFRLDMDLERA